MKVQRMMAALAIAVAILAVVVQAADLTGKWTVTFTRTAPDGQTQQIPFLFDLTQKGKMLTGTAGPNAEQDGIFGKVTLVPEPTTAGALSLVVGIAAASHRARRRGGHRGHQSRCIHTEMSS